MHDWLVRCLKRLGTRKTNLCGLRSPTLLAHEPNMKSIQIWGWRKKSKTHHGAKTMCRLSKAALNSSHVCAVSLQLSYSSCALANISSCYSHDYNQCDGSLQRKEIEARLNQNILCTSQHHIKDGTAIKLATFTGSSLKLTWMVVRRLVIWLKVSAQATKDFARVSLRAISTVCFSMSLWPIASLTGTPCISRFQYWLEMMVTWDGPSVNRSKGLWVAADTAHTIIPWIRYFGVVA